MRHLSTAVLSATFLALVSSAAVAQESDDDAPVEHVRHMRAHRKPKLGADQILSDEGAKSAKNDKAKVEKASADDALIAKTRISAPKAKHPVEKKAEKSARKTTSPAPVAQPRSRGLIEDIFGID